MNPRFEHFDCGQVWELAAVTVSVSNSSLSDSANVRGVKLEKHFFNIVFVTRFIIIVTPPILT